MVAMISQAGACSYKRGLGAVEGKDFLADIIILCWRLL
jgi:hypothetical protein